MRLRQAEHQHARRAIAETLQIGFEDAERGQGILSAKLCACRCGGVNQGTVGGEGGERFVIAEQAADTLGKRQRRSCRLGRGGEHRAFTIGKADARAEASERTAKARAETAQPFEPLLRARRQRRGKTDDLRCV